MQSEAGAPTISLQLVPKMLEPLVNLWVPHAYVVSFKLETDEGLLISKARGALAKYKHKVYIYKVCTNFNELTHLAAVMIFHMK